jgi:hypothetical protein
VPGSPSPEGRKPGICQTGQLVTREGPEGSNPSPGAHLEEISASLKAQGWKRESTTVGLGKRGRQINATKSSDVAAKEAEMDHYETLDRLIDSLCRDFSRKSVSSRLKALARRSGNAATICDHILAEQTEHNIKVSTAESKVKSLLWPSKYLNDKRFEEMTKQDILGYLNSLRKPTTIDPQQKWIGSYNNRLRYYAKFLGGFTTKKSPTLERESARRAFKESGSSPGRKNPHTSRATCGTAVNMQSS